MCSCQQHSDTAAKAASAPEGAISFRVEDMTCGHCAGTIKTAISFMGADQSWTRISVGLLLLLFVVVQRIIVARSDRR